MVLNSQSRLPNDTCEEYGTACWPAAMPLKPVSRPALVTRTGHLEATSHQHWLTTTERKFDCAMCHAQKKDQNVKSVMLH
jgi:hypothetical protein